MDISIYAIVKFLIGIISFCVFWKLYSMDKENDKKIRKEFLDDYLYRKRKL